MKLYLVHGFNVADRGDATVGKMVEHFEECGFEVEMLTYPWMFILGSYGLNWYHAKRFSKKIDTSEDFVLVGHSNGNAIIEKMIRDYGVKPKGWVAINAALDSDIRLPKGNYFYHVYFNKGDKPVKWAKYLPLHPWGETGNIGYTGRMRTGIKQFDCYRDSEPCEKLYGHSDMFTDKHVECWTGRVALEVIRASE